MPSQKAFDFARVATDALIVLGDDSGLDVFLTDKQTVSNYAAKDHWDTTSAAEVFEVLGVQYQERAADPANANSDPDRIMAGAYELCRLRRTLGTEIIPLHLATTLDQLLPK